MEIVRRYSLRLENARLRPAVCKKLLDEKLIVNAIRCPESRKVVRQGKRYWALIVNVIRCLESLRHLLKERPAWALSVVTRLRLDLWKPAKKGMHASQMIVNAIRCHEFQRPLLKESLAWAHNGQRIRTAASRSLKSSKEREARLTADLERHSLSYILAIIKSWELMAMWKSNFDFAKRPSRKNQLGYACQCWGRINGVYIYQLSNGVRWPHIHLNSLILWVLLDTKSISKMTNYSDELFCYEI